MRNEASGWERGIGVRAARRARRAVAVIGGVVAMAAGLAAPAAASPSSPLPMACSLLPALTIAHSLLPPNYDFQWAIIGDPGNTPYMGEHGEEGKNVRGRGRVDYTYRVSRLELTSAQWLPFINTFAKQSDSPFSFGRPAASGLDSLPGPPGHWRLDPDIPNAAMVPVAGINWFEAAMYCNWLNNGKPSDIDDIMDGAYALVNDDGTPNLAATRAPDAQFFLPTLDEWVKAAHWDPHKFGPGAGGWWRFPTTSDDQPISGPPGVGETSAGDFLPSLQERLIPLGSYSDVISPWGLWDASGGTGEWLEEQFLDDRRGVEGAGAGLDSWLMFDHIGYVRDGTPTGGLNGFRVASVVPSAGTVLVFTLFGAHFGLSRRTRDESRR